ncbi:MAG: hypothetical protein ABFS12_04000 [Bacteroidota bacterium]
MKKVSILNRIIFLLTGHMAGYQIIFGMDDYSNLTTTLYTISFGVLLLACLILLLMGFEIMENDYVAVIAAIIPITLSLGLVTDKFEYFTLYTILISTGFLVAVLLRFFSSGKIASLSLGVIHFLSGSVVFFIPIILFFTGKVEMQILMISFGGILIGIGGMLLGLLKAGKQFLRKEQVYSLFPIILFLTTTSFVIGLAAK